MARQYPNGPRMPVRLTGLDRATADIVATLRKLRLDHEQNNEELFYLLRKDATLLEDIAEEERALKKLEVLIEESSTG